MSGDRGGGGGDGPNIRKHTPSRPCTEWLPIKVIGRPTTLGVWYLVERSLSAERVETMGAELFYWEAFLIANTLGNAAGF